MTTPDRTPGPRRAAAILEALGMPDRHLTSASTAPAGPPCLDAEEIAEWNRRRAHTYFHQAALPRWRHARADHPAVTDWVDRYLLDPALAGSLMLLGPTGTGKTHQAYGAFAAIADSGIPPVGWVAVTEPDLYSRLRPSSGLLAEPEFLRIANAPLLLLDELGAARDTDWTEEVLFRLVDHRYGRCLPMIATSNVEFAKLKKALGDRVNSRLRQMCTKIELSGPDRRLAP